MCLIWSYRFTSFQLTTSRRGRLGRFSDMPISYNISTHDLTKRSTLIVSLYQIISMLFQLTTSRRGRQPVYCTAIYAFLFQLTTSRRGRLARLHNDNKASIFQLTTSRRGRLLSPRKFQDIFHFNSRPHEEVDYRCHSCRFLSNISTHDLTKRSTEPIYRSAIYIFNFNSRPHEEVDLLCR